MGRKPNPIILQFFERGPRLADNSNRYPHRCKACGESFPKGRAESLMTHISKKCPAISEADRINACLSLNGLSHHIAAAAAAATVGNSGVGGASMRGAARSAVHHAHRHATDPAGHHGRSTAHGLNHLSAHSHVQHLLPTPGAPNGTPGATAGPSSSPSSSNVDAAAIQRDWTALETLAEVSRQIDLSEKHDDRTPGRPESAGGAGGESPVKNDANAAAPGNGNGTAVSVAPTANMTGTVVAAPSPFDPADQLGPDAVSLFKTDANGLPDDPDAITIEQLKRLEAANLSMAAAAAAQLNPSLLDPQLRVDEAVTAKAGNGDALAATTATPTPTIAIVTTTATATATATTTAPVDSTATATAPVMAVDTAVDMADEPITAAPLLDATTASSQPWGEITYLADNILPVFPSATELTASPSDPNRISFHLSNPSEARPRQGRARFNTTRRKEVQEVRRIGACIRCRILRKTCSKGSPCDQCRKVLSPRVWRSGCVRTKFTEQLDIFCAGVQVVLAQHRANQLRETVNVSNRGLLIEATHFPENPAMAVTLEVLQSNGPNDEAGAAAAAAAAAAAVAAAAAAAVAAAGVGPDGEGSTATTTATAANDENSNGGSTAVTPVPSVPTPPLHLWKDGEIVMVDTGKDDVPLKMEYYMRNVLPEFIQREPSLFVRTLLETSVALANETNSVLLRKAIELWGLVEILDRERQWQIRVRPATGASSAEASAPRQIRADADQEIYTTLCLQLTAGAERKAAAISHSLLTTMQRLLQDSKTKIDYGMYFTTLILLNCVEKSTWGFKAWDQESLRATWPLERTPQDFAQQGYVIADLLRMLLGIRRALPRTSCRPEDGMLVTDDDDPVMRGFFEAIKLNYNDVVTKQEANFSPTDSRSFELLFCSSLLLPVRE